MKTYLPLVRTVVLAVLLAAAASPLSAQTKEAKKASASILMPGTSVQGEIRLGEEDPWYRTFRISVPDEAFGIRLFLTDSPADLDLFIKWGEEISTYDDVDAFSDREDYNEELFYSRMYDRPLDSGVYYVDVAYQLDDLPVVNSRTLHSVPFTLNYEIITAPMESPLAAGEKRNSTIRPQEGMIKVFSVDVPENAPALRVDLFDTTGDLDLLIRYGEPALNPMQADYKREWVLSRESLVIQKDSEFPVQAGTYYITVFDQVIDDAPEDFSVIATFSREAPPILRSIPFLASPEDQLERSLLSTMEIIAEGGTGSGCLVSENGLVLTNWHVIRSASGEPSEEIYGAVTVSPYNPPEELFRLKVLEYDREKDLALLQVTSGFYGQPLPFGYTFPFFELGDSRRLRIGQPLVIIGYPGIGGTGSRISVSITQGIVSGYEKTHYGTIIKTDALINGGNSGGAAINAFYELVGLPTMVVNEDAGQMGFIHPVALIPDSWLRRIAGQTPLP